MELPVGFLCSNWGSRSGERLDIQAQNLLQREENGSYRTQLLRAFESRGTYRRWHSEHSSQLGRQRDHYLTQRRAARGFSSNDSTGKLCSHHLHLVCSWRDISLFMELEAILIHHLSKNSITSCIWKLESYRRSILSRALTAVHSSAAAANSPSRFSSSLTIVQLRCCGCRRR
jgi:hypothetical protein